jgi:hypothetical protein
MFPKEQMMYLENNLHMKKKKNSRQKSNFPKEGPKFFKETYI